MLNSERVYEVRPRKDHRGVDDFQETPTWPAVVRRTKRDQQRYRTREASQSLTRRSDSRLYATGNVIEMKRARGDFKEW